MITPNRNRIAAFFEMNPKRVVPRRLTIELTGSQRYDWDENDACIEFVTGLDADAPDDENGNIVRVNGRLYEIVRCEVWFTLLELWVIPFDGGPVK